MEIDRSQTLLCRKNYRESRLKIHWTSKISLIAEKFRNYKRKQRQVARTFH